MFGHRRAKSRNVEEDSLVSRKGETKKQLKEKVRPACRREEARRETKKKEKKTSLSSVCGLSHLFFPLRS